MFSLLVFAALARSGSTSQSTSTPPNYDDPDTPEILTCSNNPPGPLRPLTHLTTCSPLIDDIKAPEIEGLVPWSYQPWCTPPNDANSKLCAFTVSSLRGGQGMSIVTTPTVAANIANNLQDPDISWLERERGERLAADPTKPYIIKQVPGKGLGVIATRPIPEDTVIMVGLPLMMQITDSRKWPTRKVFETLQHASMRLPMAEKQRLLNMAHKGKGYIVDDIMKTNTFQVTVDRVEHSGLYPEIARINHACKPNCYVRYSPRTLAVEAVVYKDIAEGEELSLSYIPMNFLTAQRKEFLENWGFNCTCSLCTDKEASHHSDHNRQRIQEVLESLDYPDNQTHEKVKAAIMEVEDLVKQEALEGQLGDFNSIVAELYLDMGDFKLAREHGEVALKMLRKYAGFDNVRTDAAVEFLEKLRKRETERK
ncbi:hypothetical protein OQA88_4369 [Cercophora sp. LCS_1]